MKKILSLILCLLMIVPCFALCVSAEEAGTGEFKNIAAEASLKETSNWDANQKAKYAIDTKFDGWFFWRPSYPGRSDCPDDYDPDNQYLEFSFREYKEIDEVIIYDGINSTPPNNDIQYTLKAVVLGEWVEVATINQKDVTETHTAGNMKMKKVILEAPDTFGADGLVTKKLRIYFDYGGSWNVPLVNEVEIMGRKGKTPAFDLPDGALLNTNAALGGQWSASSSARNAYPALAGDDVPTTNWKSNVSTNNEWVQSIFDKPYDISYVGINLSNITMAEGDTNTYTYNVTVQTLKGGVWSELKTLDITTSTTPADNIDVSSDALTGIEGIKVIYNNTNGKPAAAGEIVATIANGGKCIFLYDYLTTSRKESIANGNVAIYGEAYASSSFAYSGVAADPYFINDGVNNFAGEAWIAGSLATGEYCGVALEKPATITKVTLYFADIITWESIDIITDEVKDGNTSDYVLGFDIQAKQTDGTYKTIASGTSYNEKAKEYVVSFDIKEPVSTDDVRILFKSSHAGYAYLKEIEIFSSDLVYGGYTTFPHSRKNYTATSSFAKSFIPVRAKFLDQISPLQEMSLLDFRAALWI